MRTPREIGEIVRDLRGDQSLREFAAKCKIAHTTLDNIEKGMDRRTGKPTNVSASVLSKIAAAGNVSLAYILGEEKSPSPDEELSEEYVVFHRNGKTVKVKFDEQQQKIFNALVESAKAEYEKKS